MASVFLTSCYCFLKFIFFYELFDFFFPLEEVVWPQLSKNPTFLSIGGRMQVPVPSGAALPTNS